MHSLGPKLGGGGSFGTKIWHIFGVIFVGGGGAGGH